MKFTQTTLLFLGSLAIVASTAAADSKSEVTDAIKKLKAQPNLSWTMSPKTEGAETASRPGPIEGRTEKSTTWVKGSAGDNSFEAVIKGPTLAVNYTGTWMAIDEEDEGTARIARRLKPLKDILESVCV